MMREPLRRVLATVEWLGRDGWPVSVREVQKTLGYASTQTVHALLEEHKRLGHVATNPRWRKASGFRITEAGEIALLAAVARDAVDARAHADRPRA